ncbi:XRE family transcriptional regulator [Amycolatopsis sp. FU40]|uniref:XRE family transcriptional regulator n=1 Tax=Amycolatopsis sp. FU40 TaxID=2914159 RepID=UPI001F41593B|nr:XRE family transcriptional regulator [Amycolatopsis sp. FU40]UKD53658.1 XRE family transcriptional regulator [Amycolatopsis sp. FU40]
MTMGDRPEWAERLLRERKTRGWSQADVVRAMRTFSEKPLPQGLLDQYKRWERGKHLPTNPEHRAILAAVYGTVSDSLFSDGTSRLLAPTQDDWLLSQTGMDTLEILQRIQRSSIDNGTIDALNLTIEQLCCQYRDGEPNALIRNGREWLSKITKLLGEHLTLAQHQEVLSSAGQLALLVGCLEYDLNEGPAAEATRKAALQLGSESGNAHIIGWAHEMTSWFALTQGNYRLAISAAQAGQEQAPSQSVAVQLAAQEAKAWARLGDKRSVMQALEKGRRLLERLPYPERPDNHFIIDPDKFDFYAMDCYRIVGEDNLAAMHANEVIRKGTRADGVELSPMRNAEARITLGVVAAREGELDTAVSHGMGALNTGRQSRPSLTMVGAELDNVLQTRFGAEPETVEFHDAFRQARRSA